jgi:RND family efflux transporter MFP subunit
VERFLIDDGQLVKAGDPLVQLDDREYRAALDRTRAQLASAVADQGLAESELARGRALRARDFLSVQELDVRRSRLQVARARVAELEAAVREAEVSLEYTVLRAPTDGVVLAKLKEAGEIAVPGGFEGSGELVRLANLRDLRAEIDVNESDLSLVFLGQRAEITPDADPNARFPGEVVKLYPQIDRQKGTLKVEVRVLEADGRLLPDMSARVSFLGSPGRSGGEGGKGAAAGPVVLVPIGALRRGEDGKAHVFAVEDGRARERAVQEAGMRGDSVRVIAGLEGGERLVLGAVALRDGQRVRVDP